MAEQPGTLAKGNITDKLLLEGAKKLTVCLYIDAPALLHGRVDHTASSCQLMWGRNFQL
jgi:hypothetical protein